MGSDEEEWLYRDEGVVKGEENMNKKPRTKHELIASFDPPSCVPPPPKPPFLERERVFECQTHRGQRIVVEYQNVFALACGCAYKIDDIHGVILLSSTARSGK